MNFHLAVASYSVSSCALNYAQKFWKRSVRVCALLCSRIPCPRIVNVSIPEASPEKTGSTSFWRKEEKSRGARQTYCGLE